MGGGQLIVLVATMVTYTHSLGGTSFVPRPCGLGAGLRRHLLSLGIVQGDQPEGCDPWSVGCNVRVDLTREEHATV